MDEFEAEFSEIYQPRLEEVDFSRAHLALGLEMLVGMAQHEDHIHKFIMLRFMGQEGDRVDVVCPVDDEAPGVVASAIMSGSFGKMCSELLATLVD